MTHSLRSDVCPQLQRFDGFLEICENEAEGSEELFGEQPTFATPGTEREGTLTAGSPPNPSNWWALENLSYWLEEKRIDLAIMVYEQAPEEEKKSIASRIEAWLSEKEAAMHLIHAARREWEAAQSGHRDSLDCALKA